MYHVIVTRAGVLTSVTSEGTRSDGMSILNVAGPKPPDNRSWHIQTKHFFVGVQGCKSDFSESQSEPSESMRDLGGVIDSILFYQIIFFIFFLKFC